VAIGGAVLDRKYRALARITPATSNPVEGFRSFGGVARNVVENLTALGASTSFVSLVGNDETGRALVDHLRQRGVDVSQVQVVDGATTAEYVALLDPDKNLHVAAADMRIFDRFAPELIDRIWPHLAAADWVFADCNLSAEALGLLIARKRSARFRLAIDAVSTPKVTRLPARLDGVDLIFMNVDEAAAYLSHHHGLSDPAGDAPALAAHLTQSGARAAVVTLGAEGAVYADAHGSGRVSGVRAAPVDITGAGDAMIAATLTGVIDGKSTAEAVRIGMLLGALTTETSATVHPDLSDQFLDRHLHRLSP
jgi:pseudouridine kinase